jgi:septal ring factor EnvC (AmiA/AmiB activator)
MTSYMNDTNILDKLNACFQRLQSDIFKVQNELNQMVQTRNHISTEINELETKRDNVENNIKNTTEKLEQLNNVYANTEANYIQVQEAAKSLLDIMCSNETDTEEEDNVETNNVLISECDEEDSNDEADLDKND